MPVFTTFGETFRLFARAPAFFLLLAVVANLPSLLYSALVPDPGHLSWAMVSVSAANFLIVYFFEAAMIWGADRLRAGRSPDIGAALGLAARRYPVVLASGFLTALIIGGGVALLIVPGVYWSLMLFVVMPAATLEPVGPIESLKRSAFLTKGVRWRLLGLSLIFYLPIAALTFGLAYPLTRLHYVLLSRLANVALSAVTMPLSAILMTVIFVTLVHHKDHSNVLRVFK